MFVVLVPFVEAEAVSENVEDVAFGCLLDGCTVSGADSEGACNIGFASDES